MSITLHAQPYDITATGFYFSTAEEFDEKVSKLTNDFGDPVEEFEIQFIDGEQIDCELAKAIDLSQGTFRDYKRLEDNSFTWPAVKNGVMRLEPAQFEALFAGLDWRRVRPLEVAAPAAAE